MCAHWLADAVHLSVIWHAVFGRDRLKPKPSRFNLSESRRDQEEGSELDSHEEVRLPFAGPSEIKRREVVLDPQESPEEIKSKDVELG